jgi:hydroxymethylglutaryl-CoA lyase
MLKLTIMGNIKITESPRDAIQGLTNFISKGDKVNYLNYVIGVGFDVVDIGSFVSPRAVPQMRDTPRVLDKIKPYDNNTKLMVLVANMRGAVEASHYPYI